MQKKRIAGIWPISCGTGSGEYGTYAITIPSNRTARKGQLMDGAIPEAGKGAKGQHLPAMRESKETPKSFH